MSGPSVGYVSQADAWRAGYEEANTRRSKEIAKLVKQLRDARESRDRYKAMCRPIVGVTVCPVTGRRI